MKRLSRDRAVAHFDKSTSPVLTVSPGEQVVFETQLGALPATGPLAVDGAQPGDALVVSIDEIRIEEAHMWWRIGSTHPFRQGVYSRMGEELDEFPWTVHPRFGPIVDVPIPIEDGCLVYSDRVRVSLRPVIGCIGTAPAGASTPTNFAGHHGGNMDCRDISPGATVYLPVSVSGGLLGVCDLHGAQPDSEVMPPAECMGEAVLTVGLNKDANLPMPFVATATTIQSIGCGATVAEATDDALRGMVDVLRERLGWNYLEATQLLGACADVRYCAVVNPVFTMRVVLPREVVPGLDL